MLFQPSVSKQRLEDSGNYCMGQNYDFRLNPSHTPFKKTVGSVMI